MSLEEQRECIKAFQSSIRKSENALANMIFPSLESMYVKSAAGSPQRTLLARRIKAFQLAIQAMEDHSI
ncbi:hypothetical protein [Paenibacillus sp. PCH8]|uniref:hypothetical protein n=1 Tax=Paenibacillus sp. PCH8 TaxID=2066524 RepID=UPI0035BE2877